MGWLRKSTDVAGRTDAVASWGERAAKLLLWVVGPSTLTAVALGGLGWLWSNLLYGALIGLAAFALTQLGFTLWAIRRSASSKGPFAEPEPSSGVTNPGPIRMNKPIQMDKPMRMDKERSDTEVQLRKKNEELQAKINRMVSTEDVLREDNKKLETKIERLRNQSDGEGLRRDWLKRECRDMAAYLRWFLKDHGHKTEDEIVDLYRERYQDKVSVLLQQLERQDLYPPEDRKGFEVTADKFPRSPMAIRNLAGTLGSIGQEI